MAPQLIARYGRARAAADRVERLGDDLLAGAALAGDEHGTSVSFTRSRMAYSLRIAALVPTSPP